MKTTAVLTFRAKGGKDLTTEYYDLSVDEERVDYELSVDTLRAIKDDAGNYIQESMVDYMVTRYEVS